MWQRADLKILRDRDINDSSDAALFRSLEWLVEVDRHEVVAYFYESAGACAYLPLFVQSRPTSFMFGEIGFASKPLTRLTVHRGLIVQASDDDATSIVHQVIRTLREESKRP